MLTEEVVRYLFPVTGTSLKAGAWLTGAHCTSVGAIARAQIFYPVVF
jgi:hypothetical protein